MRGPSPFLQFTVYYFVLQEGEETGQTAFAVRLLLVSLPYLSPSVVPLHQGTGVLVACGGTGSGVSIGLVSCGGGGVGLTIGSGVAVAGTGGGGGSNVGGGGQHGGISVGGGTGV